MAINLGLHEMGRVGKLIAVKVREDPMEHRGGWVLWAESWSVFLPTLGMQEEMVESETCQTLESLLSPL